MASLIGWMVLIAFVGAFVLFIMKVRGMKSAVDAARAEFRQQTGYDYVSALTLKASPTRHKDTPAGRFTHYFEVYTEGGKRITAQGWQLEPHRPPPVHFQVLDRRLVGAMRAFLNLVGPTKRTLAIAYPGPYPTGDSEFDARFVLHATDPRQACAIVLRADMRKALLELGSVSLLVDHSGASFGDPSDDNVYAMGASRTDVNPARAIRAAAKVHTTVEYVLNRAVGG